MWPPVAGPATYSAAGTPMRLMRHSRLSANPVETAMSGMLSLVSPALTVPGSVSDLSGNGLSLHAVTFTDGNTRRHLPTWSTRGTVSPTGAFFSVNVPSTRVAVATTAPPPKSAEHEHAALPVGTPLGSAGRVAEPGTKTATL